MDVKKAYRQQLESLLPPGDAFPRERGLTRNTVLDAFAAALARIDERARDLLREAYPLTSDEVLTDWERVTGLPDPCVSGPQTRNARRLAVHNKLGRLGGQSRQYFVDVAARAGFSVKVDDFTLFKCTDPCTSQVWGQDWRFHWEINAPDETIEAMSCISGCTEPLRSWGNDRLECIIDQLKPAQTQPIHTYGPSNLIIQ